MKKLSTKKILYVITILVIIVFSTMYALSQNSIEFARAAKSHTSKPIVTVFTHGLGGNPADWSNDGILEYYEVFDEDYTYYRGANYRDKHFIYRPNSLIETLRQKSDGNVYVLSENTYKYSEPLIDKFDRNASSPTGYFAQPVSMSAIDYSKHVIFVYNSVHDFDLGADDVYSHFKSTINAVVSSYQAGHSGIIPKMNLIGHSRGAIMNLKYATEYPDRIDSMFGMGGTYNGTALGKAIYNLNVADKLGPLSAMFDSDFIRDMANDNYVAKMRSDWNAAVAGKNIKAYAVASSFDIEFLKSWVLNDSYLDEYLNDAGRKAIYALIDVLQYTFRGSPYTTSLSRPFLTLLEILYNATGFNAAQKSTLESVINTILSATVGNCVIPLDGFNELSTQDATGYNNFKVMYRNYTKDTDFSHRSQAEVNFPHNLETSDMRTIKYIASNINLGTVKQYDYEPVSGGIKITNMNVIPGVGSTLSIPTTIDGYQVKAIGEYAFSDDFHGNAQITSVEIPASVTEIPFGAFAGCTSLKEVTFASGSQLTTLRPYAFADCSALMTINLPDSVTTIYEYAFLNCTSLTSFHLKNVSTLSVSVFAGCTALTTFSANASGGFTIDNGKAVYKNDSLLAYAAGNTATSYPVLSGTKRIEEGAFAAAVKLTSVTFPESLTYIGIGAFERCTGIHSVVLHQSCATIASLAFSGSGINDVTLYSNGNTQIGQNAFGEFPAEGKINVPNSTISYYKSLPALAEVKTQIQPIMFTVTYVTNHSQSLPIQQVYYGQNLTLPQIDHFIKVGYAFDGWYDNISNGNGNGNRIANNSPYNLKKDVILYAKWVAKADGNLKFNKNGGEGVLNDKSVRYGETVTLPSDGFTRLGYRIIGWAETPNGTVKYECGKSYVFKIEDILTLYAKWEAIAYKIKYDSNGKTINQSVYPTTYTVENHVNLPEAVSTGYAFYGWSYNTYNILTKTNGYACDLTLKAEWTVTYMVASSTKTTISDTAMILDFSGYAYGTAVNKTYTITNQAAMLTIKNANHLTGIYFYLEEGRPTPMDLIFKNAYFSGQRGLNAIYAPGSTVELYCQSNSTITGGIRTVSSILDREKMNFANCGAAIVAATIYIKESTESNGILTLIGGQGMNGEVGKAGVSGNVNQAGGSGGKGGDGGMGIVAGKLYINTPHRVDIYGGNGGNGGKGGDGGNGGSRTGVPSHGVVGATGLPGGNGGIGGDGGESGIAIFALMECEFDAGTHVYLKIGAPGDAGAGGNGGKGGRGGKGGPGKLGVHAAKGGKGGKGGNGGNGGDAYKISDVYIMGFLKYIPSNYTVVTTAKAVGTVGAAGKYGSGGAGGEGGDKWLVSSKADTGDTGDSGSNGQPGNII